MYEFESFAYLPLQKTGSTFVVRFLKQFCCERLLATGRHRPLESEEYNPAKLYLISVRDPLDQYISLYSFGVTGGGGFYRQMRARGYDSLYDGSSEGFRLWLKTVLHPENAELLDSEYASLGCATVPDLIGFQSYRYLRLALPSSDKTLERCQNKDEIRAAYRQNSIVGYALRTETLNADLADLISTRLRDSIADLDGALLYLKTAERANPSERIDRYGQRIELGERLRRRLQKREWLLHELFGY